MEMYTAGCSYWSRMTTDSREIAEETSDASQVKRAKFDSQEYEVMHTQQLTPDEKIFQANSSCGQINSRESLMSKVQEIMMSIVEDVANDRWPSIDVAGAITWKECTFKDTIGLDKVRNHRLSFSQENRREDFAILVQLLAKVFQLLATNSTSTRREIYYEDTSLYRAQRRVDAGLERVCWLLGGVALWELNVFATSKGLVCGNLKILQSKQCVKHCDRCDHKDEGATVVDCSSPPGLLITPDMVHGKVQLETVADTKCVLIVEKDAAYHRLIDEGFLDRFGPCIIITGKGYPDMNTRLLVHMIWSQLSLPIYALVDADPFGIEIMCVYRYGSAKMAHLCNRLAVPSVRWLGIHPCDVTVLSPPGYASQQMTDKDKRRAEALLRRPYIACNDEIKRQIEHMIETNRKAEIEDVAKLSTGYLTDVYIPTKIAGQQII